MKRVCTMLVLIGLLGACRDYDEYRRLSSQEGLVPPDEYAQYGREQAQAVAIAREFGAAQGGRTAEAQVAAIRAAVAYAATMPDIADVTADTFGYRLTLQFDSGWRTMVNPIDDGKRGWETPNLPPEASRAPAEP